MATVLTRWFAPVVLAVGVGAAAMAPTPARADDDWARVIVSVADVIYHGGYPYYRYDRGYRDRLVVVHDYRGAPTYYRRVYRAGPPYGNAYGYWNAPRGNCNKHGKCTTRYYDARYDHRYDDRRYGRHDDRAYYYGDRRWDDRRYDRHDHRDRDDRRWRDDRDD
ncbi:hypothetical protein JI752_006465 [Lysobacter sp. MMG2]|uniref:hypothetical protein n=1 Tax=Lysobacter sp. MMG2 TaxID=2801338 RepID=UPI001C2420EC|nr:hypothetical protein [Lysobacter sp. MMG2]MBU8975781.1 hypothetical protein [Lysobacter sp. MMG2]